MEYHYILQFIVDYFWQIIVAIGGACIYVAVLATNIKNLEKSVDGFENKLTIITNSNNKILEKITRIEIMQASEVKDEYAPANSPRELNEKGRKIVDDSNVVDSLMKIKNYFIEEIRNRCESLEPFDVEKCIEDISTSINKTHPDIYKEIKSNAYNTGVSPLIILLIGSIAMRDIIFKELGIRFKK